MWALTELAEFENGEVSPGEINAGHFPQRDPHPAGRREFPAARLLLIVYADSD